MAVVIYAVLAIRTVSVHRLGASSAIVALRCAELLPYVRDTCSAKRWTIQRECWRHHSLRALDRCKSRPSLHSFVSGPVSVCFDQALVQAAHIVEYAVRCMHKCTLLHSREDLWNAILSIMKHAAEAKSVWENKSRTVDISRLHSGEAVTHAPWAANDMMTGFGVQDPFRFKKMKLEPLGAYPVRGAALLWNAISSMAMKSGGFVIRTEPLL